MPRTLPLLILFLACLGLAACSRQQAVLQIHQELPAQSATLSQEHLHDAVLRALARSRWQVEAEHQGSILARTDFHRHSASVTVSYSALGYDIRYRDSQELAYRDGKIHKRYNALVKRLDRTIQQEIRTAQPPNLQ